MLQEVPALLPSPTARFLGPRSYLVLESTALPTPRQSAGEGKQAASARCCKKCQRCSQVQPPGSSDHARTSCSRALPCPPRVRALARVNRLQAQDAARSASVAPKSNRQVPRTTLVPRAREHCPAHPASER